jgi:translation initiation factor 2B subunit (eIF-2B alpha/beta/delta family)
MKFEQSIQKGLFDLKRDNKSGANQLIDKSLEILKLQLKIIKDPHRDIKDLILNLSKEIIESRPSMAPLINTVGYLINGLDSYTKYEIIKRIEALYKVKNIITQNLEKEFQNFLMKKSIKRPKIMLISYSSTILSLLKKNNNQNFLIYILESRPLCEGKNVAEILSSSFETHLIIDAAMGKFIKDIDFVLVGIDSILKNGSIVNKIGTYPLACIAKEHKKEVFGVGDSFKYNLKSHFNHKISIEDKPINEVYDRKIPNELFKVHNYYFDITPPQFISGIISDLGTLTPDQFIKEIKNKLPLDWFNEFI